MDRAFRGTAKRAAMRERPLAEMDDAELEKALAAPFEAPGAGMDAQEEEQALARAVNQLPERYRLVIQQRFWKLSSFGTIADVMGISTEAVRKRYTRGLDELRILLDAARQRAKQSPTAAS